MVTVVRVNSELRLVEYVPQRLWLADYPVRFAGMDLRARTTLVRLHDNGLFVHSPCPITPALREQVDARGHVAHLVAPGNYHTLHAAAWQQAYPEAKLWVCPGAEHKLRGASRVLVLSNEPPADWRDELDQVLVHGSRWMREVIFFDRGSRTLIVTDIIENYGDHSQHVPWQLRFWWTLFRMWNRPSPAPEYQLGWRDKPAARASLTRALAWDFERIVLAHGELIERDARAQAERAWRALLSKG